MAAGDEHERAIFEQAFRPPASWRTPVLHLIDPAGGEVVVLVPDDE